MGQLALDVLFWVAIVVIILLLLQWLLHRLVLVFVRRVNWERHLGVAVELDDFRFNLCKGRLQVEGGKVHNPPGFRNPELLTVDSLCFDLDVCGTLKSRFSSIEIEQLTMEGIHVLVEKPGGLLSRQPSNVQTVLDHLDKVTGKDDGPKEIEPVYDFYHTKNTAHSYHFLPAWGGEARRNAEFYAHTRQVDGAEPVYAFWHKASSSRRFHMGAAEQGEVRRKAHFFAFPQEMPGTEPVYAYWYVGGGHQKKQRLHFGEARDDEEQEGKLVFYAYRTDPSGKSSALSKAVPVIKGVRGCLNVTTRKHTVHFSPPWRHERLGKVLFEAYDLQARGTEPVYAFWHKGRREFTFHTGAAWDGEERKGLQFHAYTTQVKGTEPVHAFWNQRNQEHTFHMGKPWGAGETKGEVVFYAYPHKKNKKEPPAIILRKVCLNDISMGASKGTAFGLKLKITDVQYEDFADETGAYKAKEVAKKLIRDIIHNVHFHIGSSSKDGSSHSMCPVS